MQGQGTFDLNFSGEAAHDVVERVALSRARIDKVFHGTITGTSVAHMLACNTGVEKSAGYVAIERIHGTIDGREGTFCVLHIGVMDRGARGLTVRIVPDSGTGELRGIRGEMTLRIEDNKHHYRIEYAFGEP